MLSLPEEEEEEIAIEEATLKRSLITSDEEEETNNPTKRGKLSDSEAVITEISEEIVSRPTNRDTQKNNKNNSHTRKDGVMFCHYCAEMCPGFEEWEEHRKAAHLNDLFCCNAKSCSNQFTTYEEYQTHCRERHNMVKPYFCAICRNDFADKKRLLKHLYSKHGPNSFHCSYCYLKYRVLEDLSDHMFGNHTIFNECNICNEDSDSLEALAEHRAKHLENGFLCLKCEARFDEEEKLVLHCRQAHPNLRQKVNARKKKRLKEQRKNTKFLCSTCGKEYGRMDHYTIHQRTHTGEKPFACEHCDYRATNNRYLLLHEQTHTGVRPYKCQYCEKTFSTKGYLTIHERFHTGDRPYICSYGDCKKGFTNSKDLKVHERSHSGIKLFSCNECESSFTTLHYLRVHSQKVHSIIYQTTAPHGSRPSKTSP